MEEICLKSRSPADLVIRRRDFSFMYDAGKVTGISITIRQALPLDIIKVILNSLYDLVVIYTDNVFCSPVKARLCYSTEYIHTSGPYFNFIMVQPFLMHLLLKIK